MNEVTFRPEQELRTAWVIVWFIFYFFAILCGIAPWLAEVVFGARINGSLPTLIMTGSFTLIMLPILVWIPAYYRSLEYRIDAGAVRGKRGVFWKRIVTVPYGKITNIDITQGPLQRAYGFGDLHLQTAGAAGSQGGPAELVIRGVRDLEGLKENIMDRIATAKGLDDRRTEHSETETLELILGELREIRRLTEDRK